MFFFSEFILFYFLKSSHVNEYMALTPYKFHFVMIRFQHQDFHFHYKNVGIENSVADRFLKLM